jgi:hypothetical protein
MLPAPVVPATECIVESDARLPHLMRAAIRSGG